MSLNSASSKQVSRVTYKIKNKLNESNWYIFYQEISDFLNVFGNAGVEVREDKKMNFVEPIRTSTVKYKVKQDNGNITNESRKWDISKDETRFNAEMERHMQKLEQYKKDRSDLWIFLITNMSEDVINRLKTQQDVYNKLQ
jgi:hypothetical protein